MRYISNTPAQQKEMLGRIGAASIEALLSNVPAKARLSRPLGLPAAMAETDLVRHLRALAAKASSSPRTRPISPRRARARSAPSSSTRP